MNDRPPPSPPDIQLVTFDAIMPAAMAVRAKQAGAARAAIDPLTLLVLSVLAGAFVAFGAVAATTVSAGAGELPYGIGSIMVAAVYWFIYLRSGGGLRR
jgi:formate transporter